MMALVSDNVLATLIVTLPTIIGSAVSAWAVIHSTGKKVESENVKQTQTLKEEIRSTTAVPVVTDPINREPSREVTP